jgi:DNA topoisomerase-3
MLNKLLQRNVAGNQFLKNYVFDYQFGPPWGNCTITFTSVAGHIVKRDFNPERYGWGKCNPLELFEAPIETSFEEVGLHLLLAITHAVVANIIH